MLRFYERECLKISIILHHINLLLYVGIEDLIVLILQMPRRFFLRALNASHNVSCNLCHLLEFATHFERLLLQKEIKIYK